MEERAGLTHNIEPRDILAPIATLIGLLTAALGLLAGAKLDASLLRIIVDIIVIVILSFVVTSVLTIAATSGRPSIWSYAVALYAVSWVVFGIGVVFMLVAFAYGPAPFQLTVPQLGLSGDWLTFIFALLAGLLAGVVSDLTKRGIGKLFGNIARLRVELPGISLEIENQAKDEVAKEQDAKMAFIRSIIQLENLVRQVAESKKIEVAERESARSIAAKLRSRGLIDAKTLSAFDDVWDLRNRVIHGFEVPDSIAQIALEGALALSNALIEKMKLR